MYLDSVFKVRGIDHHPDCGRVVRMRKWPRPRQQYNLYDSDLDVEEGDIIHARIQNHDPETGWELDTLHGFHHDEERGCEVCRGP